MKLSVVHDSLDLTLKMDNLANPVKSIDLSDGEIYLGYYKPIKNFYVEMDSEAATRALVLSYWNGSAWVAMPNVEDKTFGLTQSGYVLFPETIQLKTAIIGSEKYWLKLTVSDPAAVSVNGINLVLSDDKDLAFVPGLSAYLPDEMTSWIAFHQEATSQVVQYIRNSGKVIRQDVAVVLPEDNINLKQVDQFDLLDINEFKNASKYYALYLIYDYISKSDDDNYAQKSKRAFEKYTENLNSTFMSVDLNDDGETDDAEDLAIQFTRLRRV